MKVIALIKTQHMALFIPFVLTAFLVNSPLVAAAPVTSAWSCGAWVKNKNNSCIEIQKCTRSICDTKGSMTNCRNETKTTTSTDPDCTPAKPNARTLGKSSISSSGAQKTKMPTLIQPIPIPYPNTLEKAKEPKTK